MSDPLRVRMSGPLSVFAAGFREELLAARLFAGDCGQAAAVDGAPEPVDGRARRRAGRAWAVARSSGSCGERRATHAQLASARALEPLLGYLRGLGVVPPAGSREAPTPAGALLDRYAEYLRVGRGLKAATVRNYCNHARAFLADRERLTGDLALETLDVAAINDYVLRESRRVSVSSTQAAALAAAVAAAVPASGGS